MSHYILFMDETGVRDPDHIPIKRLDGMNCFGFGGILVEEGDIDQVVSMFKEFTKKWNIDYPLHSTEIRGKRNKFRWLNDDVKQTEKFHNELQNLMTNIPVVGIGVIVDREGYNERYRSKYGDGRWSLCKTTYSILLERSAKYCDRNKSTLEVLFEECGEKEDKLLVAYHKELKSTGHPFCPNNSKKYDGMTGSHFKNIVKGDPRRGTKKNIFLQIADIYLYSIAKHGYEPLHNPWLALKESGRLIDSFLDEKEVALLGVKYSCFDPK